MTLQIFFSFFFIKEKSFIFFIIILFLSVIQNAFQDVALLSSFI